MSEAYRNKIIRCLSTEILQAILTCFHPTLSLSDNTHLQTCQLVSKIPPWNTACQFFWGLISRCHYAIGHLAKPPGRGLKPILEWCFSCDLNFNPLNTEVMLFTRQFKVYNFSPPTLNAPHLSISRRSGGDFKPKTIFFLSQDTPAIYSISVLITLRTLFFSSQSLI